MPHAPSPRGLIAAVAMTLVAIAVPTAMAPTANAAVGTRIAGTSRYATAALLSQNHFDESVTTVYVATGTNFADALAGAPAAGRNGGPLLLTQPDEVPEATADELDRLQPDRIVVLGGTAAISEDVETALGDHTTGEVVRLSGVSRAATAAAIVDDAWPDGADTVLLANGSGFADALSGGAAAAELDAPILLVDADGIPEVTRDTIRRLAPSRIQLLGGPAAISDEVETAAGDLADSVGRWAGTGRYSTSAEIAEQAFGHVDTAVIATGANFPDALAAAAVAAELGAPVLLSTSDCLPLEVARLIQDMDIQRLVVAGGEGALAQAVVDGESCEEPGAALRYKVMYLHPADIEPPDRIPTVVETIDEMNAWLVDQTGDRRMRVTRKDGEIDVETLALPVDPDDPSQTVDVDDFDGIYLHLLAQGYITPRQQVAAIVEGAGSSCGRGGRGLAIVWTDSCGTPFGEPDPQFELGPFAGIMLHEMLHTLGATPSCAPNVDPDSEAHIEPTDEPNDIMYAVYNPYLVAALDPGRDDYYGHGRLDCDDVIRERYWQLVP